MDANRPLTEFLRYIWAEYTHRRVFAKLHRMGWFADIFIEYLVRIIVGFVKRFRSRNWPLTEATVMSADCPAVVLGCAVATVYYEYPVGSDKYGAAFDRPFLTNDSGKRFAARLTKGVKFTVRVNPKDPSASVPLPEAFTLAQ